ncbi:hypothetical protein [Thiomicrorhabdus sp. 6S3-12]|uniref:DUF6962 family protein n=1 Tax=Thiomicrorhabdus sp. 6S3-12 TaxID=2819681 RepID=UPI001AAD6080|nr:hypothetical protein [Thiomicrorhabdus sp. 6S3-12]MBO1924417.1 hypothetical protein [Thiomicrorhabdus sp. 6S3-12]
MELIAIPTEQTTAATNALLALVALLSGFFMSRLRYLHPWKLLVWRGVFFLLAAAAALGTLVHGLVFDPAILKLIWHPLYLCLDLLVALVFLAAAFDLWGYRVARKLMPAILIIALLAFAATVFKDNFRFFIAFEVVGMLFALSVYLWLSWKGRAGASFMTAGIILSLLAAAVQTLDFLSFNFLWRFDHNGIYHLIQIPGVLLLIKGIKDANQDRAKRLKKFAKTVSGSNRG